MIKNIETILVDIPTIRPHKLSVATMNTQTLVLVRVICGDGIVGWGEATTIGGLNYGEESPQSIKINIDTHIAPLLIGMRANEIGKAMSKVRKIVQGNRFAKCAIETALLDAQGKRLVFQSVSYWVVVYVTAFLSPGPWPVVIPAKILPKQNQ